MNSSRRYHIVLSLVFAFLLLSGCSGAGSFTAIDTEAPSRRAFSYPMNSLMAGSGCALDEEGLYYLVQGRQRNALTYRSGRDNQETTVCWNPGCAHDPEKNPDCPALFDLQSMVFAANESGIFLYQLTRETALEQQKDVTTLRFQIWSVNVNERKRDLYWEYALKLDPYQTGYTSQICLCGDKLYATLSLDTVEATSDGAKYTGEKTHSVSIVEIDLARKKLNTLAREPIDINGSYGYYLLGSTADYVFWKAEDSEHCTYYCYQIRNKKVEQLSATADEPAVFTEDNALVYTRRAGGRTELVKYSIPTSQESVLAVFDGEYQLRKADADNPGLLLAGMISLDQAGAFSPFGYLYYDLQDACLREFSEERTGWHAQTYNGKTIAFVRMQMGTDQKDWLVQLAGREQAHEFLAEEFLRVQ